MEAFWFSLFIIFLAELGDKTQLVAMTLATCYNTSIVLAGIFLATLAVHVFSAGIGWFMGELLPIDWLLFLAGISFFGFGFWTLRGDSLDEEDSCRKSALGPFFVVFTTFFIAELGDKTMLSTITIASTKPFVPVWLGSTVGMVLADALAIMVGKYLGKTLPEKIVKTGAAVIFFLFGLLSMIEGGKNFGIQIWIPATLFIALSGFFFLRNNR